MKIKTFIKTTEGYSIALITTRRKTKNGSRDEVQCHFISHPYLSASDIIKQFPETCDELLSKVRMWSNKEQVVLLNLRT